MLSPGLLQDGSRNVKARGRIAICIEPCGVAAAATPDVCRWAADEELADDRIEVIWRRP